MCFIHKIIIGRAIYPLFKHKIYKYLGLGFLFIDTNVQIIML